MTLPEFDETNYKIAGQAADQGTELLAKIASRINQTILELRNLSEYNHRILKATEGQEDLALEVAPYLYQLKNLTITKLDESVLEFQTSKAALISIIDTLIGDYDPNPPEEEEAP